MSELAFFNRLLFSSAPIAYKHLARLLEPQSYPHLCLYSRTSNLMMCYMCVVHPLQINMLSRLAATSHARLSPQFLPSTSVH